MFLFCAAEKTVSLGQAINDFNRAFKTTISVQSMTPFPGAVNSSNALKDYDKNTKKHNSAISLSVAVIFMQCNLHLELCCD